MTVTRLYELARAAAQASHSAIYRNAALPDTLIDGHSRDFTDCPHPDCALLRALPSVEGNATIEAAQGALREVMGELSAVGDILRAKPEQSVIDAAQETILALDISEALRQPRTNGNPPCSGCGGPHLFDTVVPSVRWNAVVRKAGLPEYLCLTCIVTAFVKAGESFTADLVGGEHNFEPIELRTRSQNAIDAQALSNENTALRAELSALEAASPASVEGSETPWQPIETAPKDRTIIGALIRDGKVWRVHEMKHNGLAFYTTAGGSLPQMTHWTPMPKLAASSSCGAASQEPTKDVSAKYYELLYAVESKHAGESRHDTALRYIRQAEQGGGPVSNQGSSL